MLPIMLLIVTVTSSVAIFLPKKLLHSVIFLALTATASSLILLYMGQLLVALLQLLVFVGGLSTYLIVAVASEEKHEKLSSRVRLAVATSVVLVVLSLLMYNMPGIQTGVGNSFSAAAQIAFSNNYALLFASVFLLFVTAIGSVLVIKKFSRLVV